MARQAPDLSNATPEFLIDEMAKLSLIETQVKFLRKVYKEAFYARTDIKVEEFLNGEARQNSGETFIATTTRSDPVRIDTTKLKANYPDIAAEVSKESAQLTTRFSLKEGVVNPKVESLLEEMKRELDLD